MPLDHDVKTEIISKYGRAEGDTGSPEVQVALITQRVKDLTEHLKANRHDYSSERGLKKLVGQRNRLLDYLQGKDLERYRALVKDLGLRRR